jgi:iron-sulfur cluster repair protein YtfE (RIC family)
MVPAVMRNAHEVLRGDIKLASTALEAGDLVAFQQHWAALKRFLKVHMVMEDAGMFPLLDSIFDGAITKAALGAEHEHDNADAAKLDSAGA